MSKFKKEKNSGGQNSRLSHLPIPKVFITSSEDDSTPPSRKEDFPINLLLQNQGYTKDEDAGSTAPLLDSGAATPLCEEPSIPLNMGTFLASSQKLKNEMNSEEICLSSFDREKDLEVSSKESDENQLSNLPDFPFVKWPWKYIRIFSSFALLIGILACFCSSAVLIAHLPQRCDPSTEWWQGKVFYEIFPLSFFDSDGDGFGDLHGISSKLDYLQTGLKIDVVRLNSICEASNYPENYLDMVNASKVDPHLGELNHFQSLITDIEKRNMSLVIDIVIDHIPGMVGSSQIGNQEHGIVENVLKFWLHQGVHGFYLKGLDIYTQQPDLWKTVARWKSLVDTFSKTSKRRILITSSDALLQYSHLHPLVVSNLVKQFDLVDYFLSIESAQRLEQQIQDGLSWNDGVDKPWIMWNVGTLGKPRLAEALKGNSESECTLTVGILMLGLSLPGSGSVLFGDEIGLENTNNSALMPWHEIGYSNVLLTNSSNSYPWLHSEETTAQMDCLQNSIDLFGQLSDIRKDALPMHTNAILKYDVHDVLESRTLNYVLKMLPNSKTVLIERFYPRRHRYLLILNLAKENVTHDLSGTYFGGQTLLSSSGKKNGYVKLNQLILDSGEGLLLLLDK